MKCVLGDLVLLSSWHLPAFVILCFTNSFILNWKSFISPGNWWRNRELVAVHTMFLFTPNKLNQIFSSRVNTCEVLWLLSSCRRERNLSSHLTYKRMFTVLNLKGWTGLELCLYWNFQTLQMSSWWNSSHVPMTCAKPSQMSSSSNSSKWMWLRFQPHGLRWERPHLGLAEGITHAASVITSHYLWWRWLAMQYHALGSACVRENTDCMWEFEHVYECVREFRWH